METSSKRKQHSIEGLLGPTLCMIFEAIGPYSSIAKVAYGEVQAALNAGWRVTVVSKLLGASLHGRVEWLGLSVLPCGFLIKCITARFL